MTYLNEYKNHKETQKESLTKKYTRSQNGTIIKEIPNFNFLHAKNLEQLDSMKQKNKK